MRRPREGAGQTVRLLATTRTLRVRICPLCAAVVLAVGVEQHARVHAAGGGRDDR
jgi:hypothetical protein